MLEDTLTRFYNRDFDLRRVREVFESADGIDAGLWKQIADLGVFGITCSEDHGGSGLGVLDLVVVADVLGHAASPGPFLEHVVAVDAISRLGSVEQRSRLLPQLVSGERRATMAFAQPGGGKFVGPRLTGRAANVLNASGADLVVVATLDGLALVEADSTGVSTAHTESLDRTRRIGDIDFAETPCELLPGREVSSVLDVALILIAADAAGGARRILELTTEYVNSREQFGVTIGHFQAVKHQLADIAIDVLPLRQLVWYAAHASDNALPEAPKFAALAKSHATDQYVSAARRAVELHGGIGYTWECDVQFFLKRAIFDRTFLGSPSYHRTRVAEMNGWVAPVTMKA